MTKSELLQFQVDWPQALYMHSEARAGVDMHAVGVVAQDALLLGTLDIDSKHNNIQELSIPIGPQYDVMKYHCVAAKHNATVLPVKLSEVMFEELVNTYVDTEKDGFFFSFKKPRKSHDHRLVFSSYNQEESLSPKVTVEKLGEIFSIAIVALDWKKIVDL